MSDPAPAAFDLRTTYVELADGGAARAIPVTPALWPEIMSGARTVDGRLALVARLETTPTHWEMHPNGEELLVAVSGVFEVELDRTSGRERTPLARGIACIVPRGTWHRIHTTEPGDLLAVTAGEGTQVRD